MFAALVIIALLALAGVIILGRPRHVRLEGKIRVIDGDTIDWNGKRIRIRGIDAPERAQRGGAEARAVLRDALHGAEPASMIRHGRDRYGRIVATVFVGKTDIGHAMVASGYARADRYSGLYLSREKIARRLKRGLWAAGGIDDPAAFRRANAG